jgi:hypothetical protein
MVGMVAVACYGIAFCALAVAFFSWRMNRNAN